jgi:hypothetical protein
METYRSNLFCTARFFLFLFIFSSCRSTTNKSSFDFVDYINNNDDLVAEFERWDVDSAFVQFIGFPPSAEPEFYEGISELQNISGFFNESDYGNRFHSYDFSSPIIIVYALRRNTYTTSGNQYEDMGISASDMVDYGSGINREDASIIHSLGNYGGEVSTYKYTHFYLASYDGEDRFLTANEGHEMAISFISALIARDTTFAKEKRAATQNIALYVKGGKAIQSLDPTLVHRIQDLVGFNESPE